MSREPSPTDRIATAPDMVRIRPSGRGAAGQLTVQVTPSNGCAVVLVSGEIDLSTAPELERQLVQAFTHAPKVVVDLHGVVFIDSSGIAALINAHQRASGAPGSLVLRAPSDVARRLLTLTGLDEVMTIETATPRPAGEPR